MSLSPTMTSSCTYNNASSSFELRTADQHEAWRLRIADKCWGKTGKDILSITNDMCAAALAKLREEGKTAKETQTNTTSNEWVTKCWTIITKSLHDDILTKVAHVERGHIESLLKEISASLVVNTLDEIGPLRLELYGATMQKDCNSDLQTFISYLQLRQRKLTFLKKPVDEDELVSIFIQGLHPLFQPLKVHLAIVGSKKWAETVEIVRRFASSPAMVVELAKLRTQGLSQNIFSMHTNDPQVVMHTSTAQTTPPRSTGQSVSPSNQMCRNFARGRCFSGNNCHFRHTTLPSSATGSGHYNNGIQNRRDQLRCAFCYNRGHIAADCRKRLTQLAGLPQPVPPTTLSTTTSSSSFVAQTTPVPDNVLSQLDPTDAGNTNFFSFVFLTSLDKHVNAWVLDSGATSSATYDESDCVNVRTCEVRVTAAGSEFTVTKIGTAVVTALDEQGRPQKVFFTNCLISPLFPCKLVSMSSLTKKGVSVHMTNDKMRMTNTTNDVVLLGVRDPSTQLFLLQEAAAPKTCPPVTSTASTMTPIDTQLQLAKSYQSVPSSSTSGDNYKTTHLDLLWKLHLRHGHRNFADLARQYGLPVPKLTPSCTSCIMGKAHQHPKLSDGFERAKRKAEGFHSDFRGPFSSPTPEGYLYLLTIVDDFSRRIFGFLAKSQAEWMDIWTKFVLRVEAELGKPNCISWILTDNGSVYKSVAMAQFCAARGIQQRFSGPYAQWMNHTAERNMRTIGEMITTTIIHSNLPKKAWGYATMLAIEVINRTADSVQPQFKNTMSRLERWKGKELPGQTKGLYPLGCLAFKLIPPQLRTKLDAHSTPHVYLGIDPKSRAYLLGSLFDLRLSVTVEATFVEHVFPFRRHKAEDSPANLLWEAESNPKMEGDPRLGMFDSASMYEPPALKAVDLKTLKAIYAQNQSPRHDVPLTSTSPPPSPRVTELKLDPITSHEPRVDSLASLPPPFNTSDEDAHTNSSSSDSTFIVLSESMMQTATPRHAHQAVTMPRSEHWIAAMNREKTCHLKNGTFGEEWDEKTMKPVKVTPADWVFRIKHRGPPIDDSQLLPSQYKARVVIKGQFMKEGIDFNDTFAPVAKHVTVRSLFAVATKYGCKVIAGDVETAFLASPIDCEIWIRMPPYWGKDLEPITGAKSDRPPRRLLKGVPGIPQGSRLFYNAMSEELKKMNYKPSQADMCLFFPCSTSEKERVALLLWVDDFLLMYEQEQTANAFLARLRQRFNIPTVGPLSHFLGMDIKYKPETRQMFVSQEHTTEVLLERANMQNCNPVQTPCPTGTVFSKADCPTATASPRTTEYASLIALANYLACWTRPDIVFTVNKLCKYMSNPGDTHWQLLKHLLRYLKGTKNKGLVFDFTSQSGESPGLHGFSDSSHADCPDTRHSTIAYVFRLDNAVLSWFSKLHSYVTSCTNHSEYAALFAAAKEAQWLVYLFQDFRLTSGLTPIPIYVDSSGVVSMVFNPVDHQSNKHVSIAHHYSRELTTLRVIAPQRVPSAENVADAFTKPLAAPAFLAVVPKLVNFNTS